jgi:hypothetical protein
MARKVDEDEDEDEDVNFVFVQLTKQEPSMYDKCHPDYAR